MKNVIFTVLVLIFFIGCGKEDVESQILESDLLGCWNHDFENQETESSISYLMLDCNARDFGQSWFRYSLILEEEGVGSEFQLAENDAHSYFPIKWTIDNNSLLIENEFGTTSFSVEKLNKESILLSQQ